MKNYHVPVDNKLSVGASIESVIYSNINDDANISAITPNMIKELADSLNITSDCGQLLNTTDKLLGTTDETV